MYDLGIVGGMGPEATAELFRRIILMTDAHLDQEHISICIVNKPQILDRTEYILNNGPSPLAEILEGINELKSLGAKHFVIPCNTSHIFSDEFGKVKDIIFIDMIKTTKNYLCKQFYKEKVCILCTKGTASAKVYGYGHNYDEYDVIYPKQEIQDEIMNIILSVKANNKNTLQNRTRLIDIMKDIMKEQGNCIFVIACTELSVIISNAVISGIQYVDAMDLLAINAIIQCGYKVNTKKTNINISAII